MSRELKRVPLDFDWPIGKVWEGFITPDPEWLDRSDINAVEKWEESGDHDEWYDDHPGVEPPTGEGYQMWEDVSEGSPISPVFETKHELAKWLSESPENMTTGNYDQWMATIESGWAPSLVVFNPGDGTKPRIRTGVQASTDL